MVTKLYIFLSLLAYNNNIICCITGCIHKLRKLATIFVVLTNKKLMRFLFIMKHGRGKKEKEEKRTIYFNPFRNVTNQNYLIFWTDTILILVRAIIIIIIINNGGFWLDPLTVSFILKKKKLVRSWEPHFTSLLS